MKMIPVDSSNVESVGYDEGSSTLQVSFKKGGMYQYFDVPKDVFEALRDASSVGGYLASHIKGRFRYSRV